MRRRSGGLFNAISTAAATAAVATVIAKLEDEAKANGKDILDVAKEKVDSVVADAKSGDLQNNIVNFASKAYEDMKSGELANSLSEAANTVVQQAKSGELKEKAIHIGKSAYNGVVDMIYGPEEPEQDDSDNSSEQ